jgi:thiamine-phosphate pyrophosphorylase
VSHVCARGLIPLSRNERDRSDRSRTSRFLPPRTRSREARFPEAPFVYLVATSACSIRPLTEQVALLVAAGVGAVQLREKELDDRRILELARRLKQIVACAHVPLILNDRLDLVRRAGAAGVHLGRSDSPIREARRLLGSRGIVGATAHSLEEAVAAEREGADYLGVGPVFESTTKQAGPPREVAWLRTIVESVAVPCIAIGGIGPGNAAEVARAGVRGVAACSTLLRAGDPFAVVAAMCAPLRASRRS